MIRKVVVSSPVNYKIRYVYMDGLVRHIGEFYCNKKETIINKCLEIRKAHPDAAFIRI